MIVRAVLGLLGARAARHHGHGMRSRQAGAPEDVIAEIAGIPPVARPASAPAGLAFPPPPHAPETLAHQLTRLAEFKALGLVDEEEYEDAMRRLLAQA
jgi:hypothetical protein